MTAQNPFANFNFGLGDRTAAQGIGDALLGFAGKPELALGAQQQRREQQSAQYLGELQARVANGEPLQAVIANEFKGPNGHKLMQPGVVEQLKMMAETMQGPGVDPFTLSAGQARFGPDGKQIAALPNAPQAGPSSIQEMQALGMDAQQYAAWKRSQSAGTTINTGSSGPQVGTIPQGFQLMEDKATGAWSMAVIPGGPADLEQKNAASKEEAQQKQREAMYGLVSGTIDHALKLSADDGTTGWRGAISQAVPGTPGHDLASTLSTIEANIAFETLQAMRAASPTGAALGSVSDQELGLLKSTMGSLKQSQSKEQFRTNMLRLKERLAITVHGAEAAEDMIEGARTPLPQNPLEERAAASAAGAPKEPKKPLTPEQLQAMPIEDLVNYYAE